MENLEKTKRITGVVLRSIWLVVTITLWIVGLVGFNQQREVSQGFLGWVVWGILCIPGIIGPLVKLIVVGARDGWKQGANEYSASIIGNTMYVENHPVRGAILQIVVNIVLGVLVGPVILAFNIFKNGVNLYNKIVDLVKSA